MDSHLRVKSNDDSGSGIEVEEVAASAKSSVKSASTPSASLRTPVPSDLQQAFILMRRNLKRDRKKLPVWWAKTFLPAAILMLYTIGFYLGYDDPDEGTRSGNFVIHDAKDWSMPEKIYGASNHPAMLEEAAKYINGIDTIRTVFEVESAFNGNKTSFADFCEDTISDADKAEKLCVYFDVNATAIDGIDSSNSLGDLSPSNLDALTTIYFGGDESLAPFTNKIAGAQYWVQAALWNVTASNAIANNGDANDEFSSLPFPIDKIRSIPTIFEETAPDDTDEYIGMTIGILTALTLAITAGHLIGPMLAEKVQDVHLAFVRAGVRLRTYVLQWYLYMSINGIFTAIVFTAVSVGWKLYPKSSIVLIFISHYLSLLQFFGFVVMVTLFSAKEEMAQNLPFLTFLLSTIVTVVMIAIDAPQEVLSILSVLSPFISIINYSLIYYKYDVEGYNTGITSASEIVDSGLIGSIIASICGVIL
mmetsp:Transcript_16976/g.46990  ORF Transcript_16976/g.46990 Transcript_16976/m.46990 type:complete len:476 (-) Transcript_16976:44-1471(-)|eukprot:CAMPEP_0198123200 /NCGR_PEP_ID=MMETSP1442-20131203/36965_1 /TAXON_ID= /ORGANISM="Craspedostauros australis, Strain CCMP3328" /LENGTH=475 /DNA_ID=CAMNT_0043782369 /DNA_START=350 /DNA_END=1780 /DNA_ORIENTATION=-